MSAKLFTMNFDSQPYTFTGAGWFNATEAAKRFGKRPIDWLRLPETEKYIDALVKRESQKSDVRKSHFTNFVKTKKGNSLNFEQGTWLHPKLAVRFAQWLDIDFAIWCDEQIDSIVRASYEPPNMIKLLLADTVSEWELRFSSCFYHALAKMTGTKYQGHNHGTPALFGNITLKWVYSEIMPPDVLAEVKTRKKDSEKIHQWLSIGGAKSLDQQITKIQTIAETSTDFKDFESRCYQASAKVKGQLRLVYP